MSGNTYGKNRFRLVLVRCQECEGKQETNMQCETGTYEWWCELCGFTTEHTVAEVEPIEETK